MYHQYRQLFDYTATLSFWRTLEEKYRERKKKWFNLNPKEVRPIPEFPLESAVLRTTVPLDDEIKGVAASKSSLSAEDYTDAVTDKEFSDVDSELFVDPGDQRKSTLDDEAWQRICAEIRALHMKAETEFEWRRKVFLYRLIFATAFALIILMGLAYLMWQAFLTAPSSVPAEQTSECTIRCYGGAETVVSEIMDTVFPKPNVNDEHCMAASQPFSFRNHKSVCLDRNGHLRSYFSTLVEVPKTKITEFANSVDLNEVAHKESPHLDLHCLPSSL